MPAAAVGLPIALSIGFEGFIELLEGAHEMDRHFIEAPLSQNMPVLMALVGTWYINFIGSETQAVVSYDQALNQLAAFLKQRNTESHGKSVNIFGHPVNDKTGPIVGARPALTVSTPSSSCCPRGRATYPSTLSPVKSASASTPMRLILMPRRRGCCS